MSSKNEIIIKKVKPTRANLSLIDHMDAICFPTDTKCHGEDIAWWIAYKEIDTKLIAVGYAGLKLDDDPPYFIRVGVLPDERGQGIANLLTEARIQYAKRIGLKEIVTCTNPYNVPSMNNLIRHGFLTYKPNRKWAGAGMVYWIKEFK